MLSWKTSVKNALAISVDKARKIVLVTFVVRTGTRQYKIVSFLPKVSRFGSIISTWKKKVSVHMRSLCMNLLQFGSYSLISFVVSKNLWDPEAKCVS